MWMRAETRTVSTPERGMRFGLAGLMLAVAAALSPAAPVAVSAAHADTYTGNNAARVSGYIKPCFGMLLDAQLRTCGYERHYRARGYEYGYYGRGSADAVVDCDRAHGGYVEEVARRIRPGGILYLKAHTRSCIASLDITHSITIIGEGYGPNQIPVLVAPDGQPCIRVSPSADHVILKNVYFSSPRGQEAACVEGADSEITIQNSEIRYQGNGAAVHLAGGRLNITENSHLIAKTRSVALAVTNATLFAENSEIATTSGGIYATLDGDSAIQGVSIQQLADWHGFERGEGATGVEVTLDSGGSILSMNDLKVLYFSQGITLDGAGEALLSHSMIARSDHGITSSLKRTRIIENTIIANEIGVDVEDGTAYIGRNQIANMRTAGILASSDGEIRAVDNEVDPNGAACPTLQWGKIEPAQRVCTPWYKGSEFDVPGDANDQFMFDDFWPRMTEVAMSQVTGTPLAPVAPVAPNTTDASRP